MARQDDTKKGYIKGQATRFVPGHKRPRVSEKRMQGTCGSGICECGCGQKTALATQSSSKLGHIKGQPVHFIAGHFARTQNPPLAERFWSKVDKKGPLPSAEAVAKYPEINGQQCWVFGSDSRLAHKSIIFDDRNRPVGAHRLAWFLETGKWPEPLALHKCDRGFCVRFSHLFEGSNKDNTQDMISKGRAWFQRRYQIKPERRKTQMLNKIKHAAYVLAHEDRGQDI